MNKYETAGKRFWAAIIDILIFLPVPIMTRLIFGFNSSSLTGFFISEICIGIISVGYYVLMHAYFGKTVGKMLMHVKVVDISEKPITFIQAILRSVPQILPVVISISFNNPQVRSGNASEIDIFFAENVVNFLNVGLLAFSFIDAVTLLINQKHRAIHDLIAGTVVIRD